MSNIYLKNNNNSLSITSDDIICTTSLTSPEITTLKNVIGGTSNTGVGYQAGSTSLVTGTYNTFVGYNSTSTIDSSYSSCFGYNATITASNQIVLGTLNETVYIVGGFNMSISTVSSTSTLTLPLQSNYFTLNGSTAITIILPTPVSGSCISIRRGINATGSVTVAYSSIVAYNSTTSSTSISNSISSSYIFYSGVWYQESSF